MRDILTELYLSGSVRVKLDASNAQPAFAPMRPRGERRADARRDDQARGRRRGSAYTREER
jgi:hypothetical protein